MNRRKFYRQQVKKDVNTSEVNKELNPVEDKKITNPQTTNKEQSGVNKPVAGCGCKSPYKF